MNGLKSVTIGLQQLPLSKCGQISQESDLDEDF